MAAIPSDAPAATPEPRKIDVRAYALTVLTILASVPALQWARPLLVPILLAILISYALEPIVRRLVQWRIPHAWAATLVFTAMLARSARWCIAERSAGGGRRPFALGGAGAARGDSIAACRSARSRRQGAGGGERAPEIIGFRCAGPRRAAKVQTVAIEKKPFDLGDYLWRGSLSVTGFLGDTIVVLFLALYLLLAGDTFRHRFIEIAGPRLSQKKNTLQILDAIDEQISRYLFVRAVISLIVGVGSFAAFWAIGLQEPIVWGVAAALLNVIPYVGPAAITVSAAFAAFIQFHSVSMAAATAGLATLVACIEAYAITPWLMSRTAEMNPAAVFIGLVFWGFLWGLPGLFLSVPIIMVLKSVSDHVEALQPIATLLRR